MKLRNKKTGEVRDVYLNCIYDDGSYDDMICYSLRELCNEWDDYNTAEPLIKDEKVRKAVRAWAEVNGIDDVAYDAKGNRFGRFGFTIMFDYDFDLNDGLKNGGFYTIAELCGEGEE